MSAAAIMPAMLKPRLLALALLGACGGATAPAPAPVSPPAPAAAPAAAPAPALRTYDAATLFQNVRVEAADFSRDGSRALVAMDTSGVANLYAIPTAGGEPVRLTESEDAQTPAAFFPTD